jgi:hypothetical protein
MEYIDFDTCPVSEKCVQMEPDGSTLPQMRQQARQFVAMLNYRFPNATGRFTIARNSHDFGDYLSVQYHFFESDQGWHEALFIENHLPEYWADKTIIEIPPMPEKETA